MNYLSLLIASAALTLAGWTFEHPRRATGAASALLVLPVSPASAAKSVRKARAAPHGSRGASIIVLTSDLPA